MSDINELIHAIRLAEWLAEGVAREFGNTTRIREMLASARIRADELAGDEGVDLIDDHAILDDRLRRAMVALAKEKGVEVEQDPYAALDEMEIDLPSGATVRLKASEADFRILVAELEKADEGAQQHRSALRGYLDRAKLALARHEHDVRDGLRPEDAAERRRLKLAALEAEHALLLDEHSRKSQAA